MPDEGELDPWVAEWLEANPIVLEDFTPEIIELTRGSFEIPVTREVARVHDDVIAGRPVRIYEPGDTPTGVVVYFHGGGFCIGSVALMDNVARELSHATGAVIISVEYRLAPEHPYPAGLDDCEAVTRWALANTASFGGPEGAVLVAGESAGGNLAAAVSLRLRDTEAARRPLGQILIYPVLDAEGAPHPSRTQFAGLVVSQAMGEWFWASYRGDRDIDRDPYAAPLHAPTVEGLPPALMMLGGCDLLRDEGRAYAKRLREARVETEEICFAGQPHGFVNFDWPVAGEAFAVIGRWARRRLA